MKDTPEVVREITELVTCDMASDELTAIDMLHRYADLLERLARRVSDNQVIEARRAYSGRETIDSSDFMCNSWMRAALESYRASLLGETK